MLVSEGDVNSDLTFVKDHKYGDEFFTLRT